jgi:transcriptional regulator with XRE-family HTH domain
MISTVSPEPLGQRIARLRARLGWTQNDLAERLAASRVAISHFEAGLAVPSERTIIILAGVFGMEPTELVEGTAYPEAKAERLPLIACRYTTTDLRIALLQRDLDWLSQPAPQPSERSALLARWERDLRALAEETSDPHERAKLEETLQSLRRATHS